MRFSVGVAQLWDEQLEEISEKCLDDHVAAGACQKIFRGRKLTKDRSARVPLRDAGVIKAMEMSANVCRNWGSVWLGLSEQIWLKFWRHDEVSKSL
jgi:hypothetical protein